MTRLDLIRTYFSIGPDSRPIANSEILVLYHADIDFFNFMLETISNELNIKLEIETVEAPLRERQASTYTVIETAPILKGLVGADRGEALTQSLEECKANLPSISSSDWIYD